MVKAHAQRKQYMKKEIKVTLIVEHKKKNYQEQQERNKRGSEIGSYLQAMLLFIGIA